MTRDWAAVLHEHVGVVQGLAEQGPTLDAIAEAVVACLRGGNRVYTVGNGGSAADAQHIAAELLGRFKTDRQALPAMALSTDTSTITAVANDLGYEQIFARQLEGLAASGDLAWVLSTSGNSPNVLRAAEAARRKGARVIGFTGESGGRLAEHCDYIFRAPHGSSDRIQEAHLLAYHYICERVEGAFAS